ncbi:MAG: HAMP domain-containing histidine kinase, partial [Pseudomonadota bacterium]|nr:HAMP domain-containing histidine kinase [Pseudomonadota bacterium]
AKERARMLTAVAHDLRTPLTSLRLRIETVPEPQRARMVADADRLQVMIRDVLDFARTTDSPRQRVAVRPLLAQIIVDMPAASGALALTPGAEASILVVEQAFRRAVENLVRNAIDYAGGGRIELRRDDEAVVVEVIDKGPGIAAEDRERLLRPFERGEASRNRETGGVGLGLSIVQSFVELHGGSLMLGEAPGGGTIAALYLPSA